jgi:hypothetical protein
MFMSLAPDEITSIRHCEERSDEAIQSFAGLFRFARNDDLT